MGEYATYDERKLLQVIAEALAGGGIAVTLDPGDVEIGAVELKNGADDTRATVKSDGTNNALVVTQNAQPLPTGAATQVTLAAVLAKLSADPATQTTLAAILAKQPTAPALDGTDITTPFAMPTGGVGIRGWLSAIWTKLNSSIAVTGTFFQATQPVSGTVTATTPLPAAAALADATANPTVPSVGSELLAYNGTTWDRVRAGIVGVQTTFTGLLNAITMLRYNATPPTLADGNIVGLQGDANGYLKGREQYAPVYEDNTAGKAVVEHRYSFTRVTADGQIKASAGFIHTISFAPTTALPTAGLITIYDNTAESGTIIYSEWMFAAGLGHTILLDVVATTGIYVGYDAAVTNVSCTVTYR